MHPLSSLRMRLLPALAIALATLAAPATVHADVEMRSVLGYEGTAVSGAISPVTITLKSTETRPISCEVELYSNDGMGVTGRQSVRASVFLAPGATRRVVLPMVFSGYGPTEWMVRLTSDRATMLRQGERFMTGRSLVAPAGAVPSATAVFMTCGTFRPTLGILGAGIDRMTFVAESPTGFRPTRSRVLQPTQSAQVVFQPAEGVVITPVSAPDTWLPYEGFDGILWVDPDATAGYDAAQLTALLGWAERGGRLTLALTPSSRIPAGSEFSDLLPAHAAGFVDTPILRILNALGATTAPRRDRIVPVARLASREGRPFLVDADGVALGIERDFGLGTLRVLAFDPRDLSDVLAAEPDSVQFDGARFALLHQLVGPWAETHIEHWTGNTGITADPVVEHLRRRFLRAPPLGLLVLGLVLYVLAIGPGDYFYLKRRNALRRTVYTFPIIVFVFTLVAYGGSFLLFGATSGRSRVAWIDLATSPTGDADIVRGLDLAGLYSPVGTTWTLQPSAATSVTASPWLDATNDWRRSMDGSTELSARLGDDGRPTTRIPVPLRAQRSVQTRFGDEIPSSLDATVITGADGMRMLNVRNGLPLPLRDTVLVTRHGVLSLGDLASGASTRCLLPTDADTPEGMASALEALVYPFQDSGLFGAAHHYWSSRRIQTTFAPDSSDEKAWKEATLAMAKAAMGVGGTSLLSHAMTNEAELSVALRTLGRNGLDLGDAVRAGRPLLMGWCEGDPLGRLPADETFDAQVVVVRRLLPTVEAP